MSLRTTLSCDQPDCGTVCAGTPKDIDFALRYLDWKVEELENGTYYTCPKHEPDVLTNEQRLLAEAGSTLLAEIRNLHERGYYVDGSPSDGEGALLHVRPYDYDPDEGPFVLITQSGASFHARLLAGDDKGTVLVDEDDEVWG